jgi:hypothetical protein
VFGTGKQLSNPRAVRVARHATSPGAMPRRRATASR